MNKKLIIDSDKPALIVTVYLGTNTVVITIDKDGNVETKVKPP